MTTESAARTDPGDSGPFTVERLMTLGLIVLVMIALPRLLLTGSTPKEAAAELPWTHHKSPDGGFEVDLPAAPKRSTAMVKIDGEELPLMHTEARPQRDVSVLVACGELKAEPAEDARAAILEGVARGLRASLKLPGRAEPLQYLGRSGLQLRGAPAPGVAFEGRILLSGRRLYQVLIMTREELAPAITARVFKSFQLTEAGSGDGE